MEHVTNIWFIAAAWMLLAFVASVLSIRTGISVALLEIAMGVAGTTADKVVEYAPCSVLVVR